MEPFDLAIDCNIHLARGGGGEDRQGDVGVPPALPAPGDIVPPDGAIVPPDGAVVPPDGAIVPPDGAVVFPGQPPALFTPAGPYTGQLFSST